MSSTRAGHDNVGEHKESKPHRKAPKPPGHRHKKKRAAPHHPNGKSHDEDKEDTPTHSTGMAAAADEVSGPTPSKHLEVSKKAEKSLKRSVSTRQDQYSSLLDETVGKGDMVLLDSLTEENILENLKIRYSAGEIYVSVGEG